MIIKFYMGESYNAMACNHYHVTTLESGVVEVTLYPSLTTTDGVTYRVANFDSRCNIPHFDYCKVINDFGMLVEELYGSNCEITKAKVK